MKTIGLRCISCICVGLFCTFVGIASAQSAEELLEASPRHQEWVSLEFADGEVLSAFVVHPESSGATDSVVVIHDIRSMSDWARLVADRLAEAGYVAIVPDLLSGMGPNGGKTESFEKPADIGRAIRALDPDRVTSGLKACVKYVRGLSSTTEKVSVGGFCWGGSQTFRFATNDDTISGAYVFYGSPPAKADMARIDCPVYGFYGESHNRINSTIESAKESMAELKKSYDPVIYGGVGHGFLRNGMGERATDMYRQRTDEAWTRWLKLLKK